MIYSTATVPVNPAGETTLTRAQAWQGLVLKAREATIAGTDLREIIALEPESKVTFFQVTGPREGAIVNELFEDEAGALQLRFYCYLGLRDKAPGGPEEQAEQAQFDSDNGYKAALQSTLKRTRELLADGSL